LGDITDKLVTFKKQPALIAENLWFDGKLNFAECSPFFDKIFISVATAVYVYTFTLN